VRGLSCFPAGTLVATADGLRPIESIVSGQRVWAYDLIASRWELRHVLRTYSRPCKGRATSVTVAGETIESTARHPYFVVRGEELEGRPRLEHLAQVPDGATTPGRWVDAMDLRAGDELLLRDGRIKQIDRVRLYASLDTVYNFEVDDLHCYAVGWSGVLVHNNNGDETGVTPESLRAASNDALDRGDYEKAIRLDDQASALERQQAASQPEAPPQQEAPQPAAARISVNQMNQEIQSGSAPMTVERVDTGKILGEQTHVHFTDGAALNLNGTWKHGGRPLSNAEIGWLRSFGWPSIPG
jgi:Pretoxin HINT domain